MFATRSHVLKNGHITISALAENKSEFVGFGLGADWNFTGIKCRSLQH